MRITNSTLTTNYLRNLSINLKQMQKYQNQLASGKEVSKPSDNPILLSKIMDLNNNIIQNKQYKSNIKDTLGWVETQDNALKGVTATLHRLKDLVIYGANGPLSDTDRAAIEDEIKMQSEQLKDILNTNFDGRYIFGGQKTTEPPFEVNEDGLLTYNGDNKNIVREISQGVTVDIMTDGSEIVNADIDGENKDLGKLINNVLQAMKEGNTEALSNGFLADIDKHLDNVLRVRSGVGAVNNRLEAAESRNETENLNLTSLLSEKEDIDIVEKYMEYMVMSTVYMASLSVGANILQPSLLDFLR